MRTDKLLLLDILESIAEVQETTPPTQAEFDANKLVGSHVLRHIQIIGEACWRLSKAMQDQHPEVPWKRIAGSVPPCISICPLPRVAAFGR